MALGDADADDRPGFPETRSRRLQRFGGLPVRPLEWRLGVSCMRRRGLYLALGLLSIASVASSQSVTAAVQNLVAQHLRFAEASIGRTRAQHVDAMIALGMTCKNKDKEGTAISCSLPGGVVSHTAALGRKDRVASFSVDLSEERECSAAQGYLVSRYGKAPYWEDLSGADLWAWPYPKRKDRLILYAERPVVEEEMPYGPPLRKQSCYVSYYVGELERYR